jgi:hypothetical protein
MSVIKRQPSCKCGKYLANFGRNHADGSEACDNRPLMHPEAAKDFANWANTRCPSCGDVKSVRYENIGNCIDGWHKNSHNAP